MDLGRYSKLIGAIIGNLVAFLLAYLATRGIGECTVGPDGTDACALFGFTQAQITSGLVLLVNSIFVYAFPANRPPA